MCKQSVRIKSLTGHVPCATIPLSPQTPEFLMLIRLLNLVSYSPLPEIIISLCLGVVIFALLWQPL